MTIYFKNINKDIEQRRWKMKLSKKIIGLYCMSLVQQSMYAAPFKKPTIEFAPQVQPPKSFVQQQKEALNAASKAAQENAANFVPYSSRSKSQIQQQPTVRLTGGGARPVSAPIQSKVITQKKLSTVKPPVAPKPLFVTTKKSQTGVKKQEPLIEVEAPVQEKVVPLKSVKTSPTTAPVSPTKLKPVTLKKEPVKTKTPSIAGGVVLKSVLGASNGTVVVTGHVTTPPASQKTVPASSVPPISKVSQTPSQQPFGGPRSLVKTTPSTEPTVHPATSPTPQVPKEHPVTPATPSVVIRKQVDEPVSPSKTPPVEEPIPAVVPKQGGGGDRIIPPVQKGGQVPPTEKNILAKPAVISINYTNVPASKSHIKKPNIPKTVLENPQLIAPEAPQVRFKKATRANIDAYRNTHIIRVVNGGVAKLPREAYQPALLTEKQLGGL